ncbi:enoyl-CoA hydratase/isomerase [Alkalilimnicola sp. S0819]|uniref:enoyl-CoA hydratase/isomerase n=1 Tax=Alkalilimnicola sp. S0819 TaxID=2613922 RepID=UPI0012621592|nr:enoyl-CoA hydratase/isomerase [Alkalilimnicola sp. S0819]KAB7619598.1 enoyl-CoA hydratase/isomerase [Alkalilimnicola sp. S0819]MPQ17602.1 enoyl-CoA hydratase/isomerase [Alkalilimnicola sp. S0819]
MNYQTLDVSFHEGVCRVRFDRPEAGNAINARMIEEFAALLDHCEQADGSDGEPPVTVLTLEGTTEVFCAGGDFEALADSAEVPDPEPLYALWLRLARGPFISISVVRGRVNAGGVGFVAASDMVLADDSAVFSLSELLFGLYPACVLPFLIRRTGVQKANYLTLSTRPLPAEEALRWGLVDVMEASVEGALRKHLLRLRHLDRQALARYKAYLGELEDDLQRQKPLALAANRALFGDPALRENIRRYVTEGKFPWEP